MNKNICLVCDSGNLSQHIDVNVFEYKGKTYEVKYYYHECDACGSEIALPHDLKINKRLIVQKKKEIEGLLSGDAVKKIRHELGLNQKEAAALFGGGPVAFSKYENDDVIQSESMDRLIRVTSEIDACYWFLSERYLGESSKDYWTSCLVDFIGMKEEKFKTKPSKDVEVDAPSSGQWHIMGSAA